MKEITEETIKQASIMAEVKFMQETRRNFSPQADAVIEKIKNGGKSRESDYFILLNTDQKKIDEAIKLDDIKDRMASGRIKHSDIDFLIGLLGDVGKLDGVLKSAFYRKADEMNFMYALAHTDEFTPEEIESMKQKLNQTQTIKEILNEQLPQI